jgi:hypothetical protein
MMRSRAAHERQAYRERLRPAVTELGASATVGLKRAVRSHARYARVTNWRAAAFTDKRAHVSGLLIGRNVRRGRNVLRGGYGRRRAGGLALRSLARDLVAIGLRCAQFNTKRDRESVAS